MPVYVLVLIEAAGWRLLGVHATPESALQTVHDRTPLLPAERQHALALLADSAPGDRLELAPSLDVAEDLRAGRETYVIQRAELQP